MGSLNCRFGAGSRHCLAGAQQGMSLNDPDKIWKPKGTRAWVRSTTFPIAPMASCSLGGSPFGRK